MNRRAIPFALLGLLTAGAALGAGLGLSQGPNTVDSAPTLHAGFSICENRFLSKQIYVARGSKAVERREEARASDRQIKKFTDCLQYEGFSGGWVAYWPAPEPS